MGRELIIIITVMMMIMMVMVVGFAYNSGKSKMGNRQ